MPSRRLCGDRTRSRSAGRRWTVAAAALLAAGGLAGGLVALGGRLQPGFELVADELDLHDHIVQSDLVITGEGFLDEQSFLGKVVGGVQAMCATADRPVAAIVGDALPEVAHRIQHRSLVADHGSERAMREPLWCIEHSASALLRDLSLG